MMGRRASWCDGELDLNKPQMPQTDPRSASFGSRIAITIGLPPFALRAHMSTADTYVRARIDSQTKERAASALNAMGLSISDAIRLLMVRVADEHCLPFSVKVPNVATKRAMTELEAGKGEKFASVDALMADLNAGND